MAGWRTRLVHSAAIIWAPGQGAAGAPRLNPICLIYNQEGVTDSHVQHIGRYQVTRLLGQGGMGVVYAAHDDRLDRPVAIKVIRTEALADQKARERFHREARAAARVSHPHICPLYEFDEADGQPFLVMELLDGEPLSRPA